MPVDGEARSVWLGNVEWFEPVAVVADSFRRIFGRIIRDRNDTSILDYHPATINVDENSKSFNRESVIVCIWFPLLEGYGAKNATGWHFGRVHAGDPRFKVHLTWIVDSAFG